MKSHFYVTLPSDSSADYYPNNTVARFVTKLPERIRIEGDYEMGLAEIIYPHSWYNLHNEDNKYWIAAVPKDRATFPKVYIQSGYYQDGYALADMLNRECHRSFVDLDVKFIFSEAIGRFSLSVRSPGAFLFGMSEDLKLYMGFELKTLSLTTDKQHFGTSIRRKSRAQPLVRLLRRRFPRNSR